MIFNLLRTLLVITGTVVGVAIGYAAVEQYPDVLDLANPQVTVGALLGFIGWLLCSIAGRELEMWLEKQLDQNNTHDLTMGAVGMLGGLVCANLFLAPVYFLLIKDRGKIEFKNAYLDSLVPFVELMLPVLLSLLFMYAGLKIALRYSKYRYNVGLNGILAKPKIIDGSALIDGRFLDLYTLGLLEGNLVVPSFVVNELHLLAESGDETERARARQGIDTLNKFKRLYPDIIVFDERGYAEAADIGTKIIKLASDLSGVILTHDYNLKKISELERVNALNINDLTNALKPVLVSGEKINVKIVKRGKEPRQGVGFLSDGTMVVVEDGGENVGELVSASVCNILQTGMGRMIFTRIGSKQPEALQ